MYTNLPKPFVDWTVDDAGTIHTASGYRCTPELIEAALWLFETGKRIHGSKKIFFADEIQTNEKRPLYEIRDITIPQRKDIRVQRTARLQATTVAATIDETFCRDK